MIFKLFVSFSGFFFIMFFYFINKKKEFYKGSENIRIFVILISLFFSLFFLFISSFYVKKIEYIEKNVCGVFKYHYPKPSQRATNIELLTFNIDGYGDLTLPIERKFNMNGLNIENIKKGDRFCILIPVDKSDSNNLKTAYHILYIKIYN